MDDPTWTELTSGIVAKLTVGSMFGTGVHFDRTGSRALANVIKAKANRLDKSIAEEEEKDKKNC